MKHPASIAAGLLLLLACNQHQNEKAPGPGGMGADTTAGGEQYELDRKIVKKGQLDFEVSDVRRSSRELDQLAQGLGGTTTLLEIDATAGDSRSLPQGTDSVLLLETVAPKANLTLKIPADQLLSFMHEVAEHARFLDHSSLSIDDQTLLYLEGQLRAAARERAGRNLQPKKSVDTAGIALSDDIITRKMALYHIDDQVRYSTVNLSLRQPPLVRRTVVVNTDLGVFELPLTRRFGDALTKGWEVFTRILIAAAHVWAILAAILVGWILWRRWAKPATAASSAH